MADHINLDTESLADMGTALGRLRDEFNKATRSVDGFGTSNGRRPATPRAT